MAGAVAVGVPVGLSQETALNPRTAVAGVSWELSQNTLLKSWAKYFNCHTPKD